MEKVKHVEGTHFLPHHAVLKEDSTATKLRVVFDGSAKTTNGISLNESMHVGPKILNDWTELILRWRTHAVVFIADVEEMYRQINIHSDHQKFQRILWRDSKTVPISECALKTVSYGTAAAPFLPIRTLKQLVKDEEIHHPEASKILTNDFYVDDCISGSRTRAEAKNIVSESPTTCIEPILHVQESFSKLNSDSSPKTSTTQSRSFRTPFSINRRRSHHYTHGATIHHVETTNDVDVKMPEEAIRRVPSEPSHSASKNHTTTMAKMQQWRPGTCSVSNRTKLISYTFR
jgi:hypothetical protein